MRAVLCTFVLALNAPLIAAQSTSSPSINQTSSTAASFNQSSTGPFINQTSSTGTLFNQSSTGALFNASSSTGSLFNQSSSASFTGSFNLSSTGASDLSSTGVGVACYQCLPLVTCSILPEWSSGPSVWPSLVIHSSNNALYDNEACSLVSRNLNYFDQVLPGNDTDCADRMLNLSCSYAQYRQQNGDCHQSISSQYQVDCLNAISCLTPEAQAIVNATGYCTDLRSFLNRPIILPSSSSSSSTGDDSGNDDDTNSAVPFGASIGTFLGTFFVTMIVAMAM